MDDLIQSLPKESKTEVIILQFLQTRAKEDYRWAPFMSSYASVVQVIIDSRFNDFARRFRTQAAYLTALGIIVGSNFFPYVRAQN
jgi:hypothetical protein